MFEMKMNRREESGRRIHCQMSLQDRATDRLLGSFVFSSRPYIRLGALLLYGLCLQLQILVFVTDNVSVIACQCLPRCDCQCSPPVWLPIDRKAPAGIVWNCRLGDNPAVRGVWPAD